MDVHVQEPRLTFAFAQEQLLNTPEIANFFIIIDFILDFIQETKKFLLFNYHILKLCFYSIWQNLLF